MPAQHTNPCSEIKMPNAEMVESQIATHECLLDMKAGEVFTVRNYISGSEYKIIGCEPFLGRGVVTFDDEEGNVFQLDLPTVIDLFEIVDAAVVEEFMVMVEGVMLPDQTFQYEEACDVADRQARKHIGKTVLVVRLEHKLKAEQHVEVKECL